MNMEKESYKILIADDSELSYKMIAEFLLLEKDKVELFYAENGQQACDMATEIIPDMILMDVIMPEMNGIAAVRYLRAQEKTAEIPIIVLSATESLNSAYEAGANDFILKPFRKYELLIKVRSGLNLLQKIREINFQKDELKIRHEEVLQQRDRISRQQQDILDDINYSKRIQKAILPTDKCMRETFPEHFILNLPKNIVSGDFYWLGEYEKNTILAVADCTGHGVSGAFMTMAGTAFLNEILSSGNITGPADILFRLRGLVTKLLKQKGEAGEAADGMDISVVMLNEKHSSLRFAGANNPFYLIRDEEVTIVKGDRMPIGIHLNFDKSFTDHSLEMRSGDMIYLFTDGYADQFGGPKNKKFRYHQFQELLLAISKLTMDEQKKTLHRTITDWKGKNDQVDDILILGFRVE
jgi:sigma-B regulation protein RsbU (phosphoserine phosphatase)